jgi:hypothetical protein
MGMKRISVEGAPLRHLDNPAQAHNGCIVADTFEIRVTAESKNPPRRMAEIMPAKTPSIILMKKLRPANSKVMGLRLPA